MPLLGLGLYNGYRGERFLRNRIKIIKQFVVPSLLNQTNKNFTLWISVRHEDKRNKQIQELKEYFDAIKDFKTIFTFHGLCFYDDKYEPKEARNRLLGSLHDSIGDILDTIGEVDYVYMTIQPSDDIYHRNAVMGIQTIFRKTNLQAFGFSRGYIMNYLTKEIAEYNPNTNPPFYTIKFPRDIFTDPLKHAEFTSLKKDVGQYKKGTPLPSHEYVGDCLNYGTIKERGFIVGIHQDNISTTFNHPFRGEMVDKEVLKDFGLYDVPVLKLKLSIRKWLFMKLPHKVQKKLRYIFGEKIWQKLYNFIRS